MKSAKMRTSLFITYIRQYLLAFLGIALVTAVFFAMRDVLDTTLIALLYLRLSRN